MGQLMYIYGGIKDAFVFGLSPDGYDDIAILGETNSLRIYTNVDGRLSVDGYPVCTNSQMHMNQYAQRFIRDMDKDSRDDLVLHTT
jgi:hypothetical protein